MTLTQLLQPWIQQSVSDCVIRDVVNDSRQVQSGSLFIAYPGATVDGRLFIEKAVALGAAAVAYDPVNFPASSLPSSVPCVAIPHLAQLLPDIAKKMYHYDASSLKITGVTGTNGKTTIAYQLAQAHQLLGQRSAYIGTIGQGEVNQLLSLENTTPDALCLQKLLCIYQQNSIKQVCMEVSSHALSQKRVAAVEFNQALFTNLTLDHLDFHHTMEAYGAAKALLFATPSLDYAIINQDDASHEMMSRAVHPGVKKITYGMSNEADVRARHWQVTLQGTDIEIVSPWGTHEVHIQALGLFNIYNTLALWTSLLASGYSPSQVIPIMADLKPAPGRMEVVSHKPYVLVDYAHTPDALKNVLQTLSALKKGQLWVVFGCGGDRDKTKRPIMGKTASLHADKVVITSDNPRTEDPDLIVQEIAEGIEPGVNVVALVNRKDAIEYALSKANKEDIILIAGKGHEAYQQIGTIKHAFSDQEVVRRFENECN